MRRMLAAIVLCMLALPAGAERVIVELRQPAAKTRIAFGHVRREFRSVFNGVAMDVDAAEVPALAGMAFVKAVHPDVRVQILPSPRPRVEGARSADEGFVPGGRSPLIRLRHLLPRAAGEKGDVDVDVVVAVLDTGVSGDIAGGYDFVNDDDDPSDDNGHGTRVAAIITSTAPGVRLLAYKVIAADGWGWSSDVLAALDRAIEEGADVANLSFGATGNPDDAQSRAVDNAVAAGLVVCAAAGNRGDFYAITSPGTARNAITVGAAAANGDPLAFSSRGPSALLATIKPDLLAPGDDGTSMAAAYVAGGCAIVKSLHRDWTPQQIKSALTLTARPPRVEVMAAGAGVIDIAAALTSPLTSSRSHFSLGLDSNDGPWTRVESITVTSVASTLKSYAISISGDPARVSPTSMTLAPGESRTISVDVSVDGTEEPESTSYAYGGLVTIATNATSLHVPWAYVRASRATLTIDNTSGSFFWVGSDLRQPVAIASNCAEAFVPRGWYEVAAFARKEDKLSVVMSPVMIAGEIRLDIKAAQATHAIRLAGTDERGVPLASLPHDGVTRTYFTRFRIGDFDFIDCVPAMSVSDLPNGLAVSAAEIYADFASNRIVALQYAPVTSDATLTNTGLRHQPVTLAFRNDAPRRLAVASTTYTAAETMIHGASWSGDVYVNEEQSPLPIALMAGEPGAVWDVVTPPLRARDGRFVGSFYAPADGEPMTYGAGPFFALPTVIGCASHVSTHVDLFGFAGDARPRATAETQCTLYDRDSRIVARHVGGDEESIPLPEAEQYRVEFASGNATLEAAFDARMCDATPPVLTSLLITDGAGRIAPRLTAGGSGTLTFTATGIAADATRASFRASGMTDWQRLPLVQVDDERFRGDLSSALLCGAASIDLRIELTDASGNQTTFTHARALEVGAARRRSIR